MKFNYKYRSLFIVLFAVFLFTACEVDKNPCYDTICLDNEYCLDGNCIGVDGLNASSFTLPPTPDTLILTNLVLKRFPETRSNGSNWDVLDGPDLWLYIAAGTTEMYQSKTSIPNASIQSLPISIPLDSPIIIIDLNRSFALQLYDDDGNGRDEFMGGALATPFIEGRGYPDTLSVDLGGTVGARFDIDYVFQ